MNRNEVLIIPETPGRQAGLILVGDRDIVSLAKEHYANALFSWIITDDELKALDTMTQQELTTFVHKIFTECKSVLKS